MNDIQRYYLRKCTLMSALDASGFDSTTLRRDEDGWVCDGIYIGETLLKASHWLNIV